MMHTMSMNAIVDNNNELLKNKKTMDTEQNDPQDDDILDCENVVFNEPRHLEVIEGYKEEEDQPNQNWRSKERVCRMKTVSVAIVMCLNVGVDPPDVTKPNPCAVLQCWVDPFTHQLSKAGENIAQRLAKQYERWQPRARYKQSVDPTVEDIKKLCTNLRRNSKEERVLFHYNGHGVPKPTANGEIWVFNRNFTQYIPLSVFDLQQWMGSPSIYVFDCSNAGVVVHLFDQFAVQHAKEWEMNGQSEAKTHKPNFENCILLASCGKDEVLPLHPDLPADLFTSCLTTPLKTFIVWFIKRKPKKISPNINIELIDKLALSITDRKSILGELNWIFTAITDTIAWNTLTRENFQKLFRQDLLVASLFRNFLLAQRIMRDFDCKPVSLPNIKSTHDHPMWQAWDLAVDDCLHKLAKIELPPLHDLTAITEPPHSPSLFFTQQLTAFQVWLKLNTYPTSTPEQLPIVLQVLLSQVHRSRALDLLGNFLNLGTWAVNLALSVGIFPYVLKLLQTSARELRPFLVFIWAKIMAIDESAQKDLIRDNAYRYFVNILSDTNISVSNQVMSAFVISVAVRHYPDGQNMVTQGGSSNPAGSIIDIALQLLMEHQNQHPNLRKWLLILLGNVWEDNKEVRWLATRNANAYEKLYPFLEDPVPEVRAATVYALGTFISSIINQRSEHANEIDKNIVSTIVQKLAYESSPLVRKELLVLFHWFIIIFEAPFLGKMYLEIEKNIKHSHQLHKRQQQHQQSQTNHLEHSPKSAQNSSSPEQGIMCIPDNMHELYNGNSVELNEFSSLHSKNSSRDLLSHSGNSNNNNNNNNNNNKLPPSIAISTPNTQTNAHKTSVDSNQFTPPNTSSMIRVNSASSLLEYNYISQMNNLAESKSITNIYNRVWQVIELYLQDPYPLVAQMAQAIHRELYEKACFIKNEFNVNFKSHSESSANSGSPSIIDLPTRSSLRNSTSLREGQLRHHNRVSVSAVTSPYLPNSATYDMLLKQHSERRTVFGKGPNGTNEEIRGGQQIGFMDYNNPDMSYSGHSYIEMQTDHRSPFDTAFVDWCTKHFCKPCSFTDMLGYSKNDQTDPVSEWRSSYLRKYVHKCKRALDDNQAKGRNVIIQQKKNIDSRLFVYHPFEKWAVFANAETFSVWNYDVPEKPDSIFTFSSQTSSSKITDLQLVNTHQQATLMVAHSNGAIKIWRNLFPLSFSSLSPEENPMDEQLSPELSTAFFIFEDMPFRNKNRSNHLILSWDQRKHRLMAGGDHQYIRLWDANQEQKVADIITETDLVTSLNTDYGHLICAGCQDGVVRIFDDRSRSSIIKLANSDRSPIVNAKVWPESYDSVNIVCGHRAGVVSWFDRRQTSKAVRVEQLGSTMTAMDFHEHADVIACAYGRENGEIQFFTVDTIRGTSYTLRNRAIKGLAWHNLKARIAILTNEPAMIIYKCSLRTATSHYI